MTVPVAVIGGSAGSIEALHRLLPLLRPDWGIAFAIIIHRQPVEDDERLASLLRSWSTMPVIKARGADPIVPGRIVVCPANVHLTVDEERFRLTTAPKENHARPSLDVTFRSIADFFGPQAGAIVLSGFLDDGAAGIAYLRARGGFTMAQDPNEAINAGMPQAAISAGAEFISSTSDMPEFLSQFSNSEKSARFGKNGETGHETRFTCPDCHGVLVEYRQDDMTYFRCRVGHAYSPSTLDEQKDEEVENALWTALQVLEEQIDLNERAARRARDRGAVDIATKLEIRAERNRKRVEAVRRALPNINDAIESSDLHEVTK